MNFTRKALVASASVAVGIAMTTTCLPVQAAEISPGRAMMYTKASGALTLKTGADNTYSMVIPQGSNGKWLGSRKNSNGKKRSVVGKLTARDIVKHWSDFKYTKAGVLGTLAWGTKTDAPRTELVKLARPVLTKKGVKFTFVARHALPVNISGVSLNLRPAPKSQALVRSGAEYGPYEYNIADDLWTTINVVDSSYEVDARIYNATNNNTCWTGAMYSTDATTISVKQNTCDNIQYKNYVTSGAMHGATTLFEYRADTGWYGQTTYVLNLTPKNQSMYEFNQIVATWNWPTS